MLSLPWGEKSHAGVLRDSDSGGLACDLGLKRVNVRSQVELTADKFENHRSRFCNLVYLSPEFFSFVSLLHSVNYFPVPRSVSVA